MRNAHNLTRVECHPLESRGEIERLMPGSGRGRWNSTCKGNSLAAYSTARTVTTGGMERRVKGYRALSLPTRQAAKRPGLAEEPQGEYTK